MNARAWAEVVAAYEDCVRAIDTAFADPKKDADLDALHERLLVRLDALTGPLAEVLGPGNTDHGIAPLAFTIDEKVELHLRSAEGEDFPEWPQIQRLVGETCGGDVFYTRAKSIVDQRRAFPPMTAVPSSLSFLAGLYLFCLGAGFVGRHFDNPQAIQRWREDLAECLPAPPASSAASGSGAGAPAARARPLWRYALVVAGGLVALQIVLLAIARAM